MEEKSIFQTLIDINNRINYEYRTSKMPRFIKVIKFSGQRKKLYKMVDSYAEKIISGQELIDYITIVSNTYDNGRYKHCAKCDHVDDRVIGLFIADVEETEWKVSCGFTQLDGNTFDACYSIYDDKNNIVFRFTEESKDLIIDNGSNHSNLFPWNSDVQAECIKDAIAEVVLKDIKEYLNEMIDRSERIDEDG